MYYLSVDGGGSKTAFLITDEAGHTVAEDMADGCSHPQIGINGVSRMIPEKLKCLLDKAGLNTRGLGGAAFGLPCYGEGRKADRELGRTVVNAANLPCTGVYNDVELGWASSLGLDIGIHVVAGTGTITYGRDISRDSFRSNGWHGDFSDERSGYWLGMQAISLSTKQADGRLERSFLYQRMREGLSISGVDELVPLYRTKYMENREKIAALQRILFKAAADRDSNIAMLYDRGAEELATSIGAVASGLHSDEHSSIPVSYSGDVFSAGEFIMKSLKKALGDSRFDMRKPLLGPVQGGILLAVQQTVPNTMRSVRLVLTGGDRGDAWDGRENEEEKRKMFLTEKEIVERHVALTRIFQHLIESRAVIEEFFQQHTEKKFLFLGCSSSYMLTKTGRRKFAACGDTVANTIAGGNCLVSREFYEETVRGSIAVVLSRSGQTTEIVESVKEMKGRYNNPVISISAKTDNDMIPYSNLDLTLDWHYDQSVSQTRTVTNLYMAVLFLAAIYQEDDSVIAGLFRTVLKNKKYKEENRSHLRKIAGREWDNVIILADGPVVGVREEGALAFTEIAMIPGRFSHLLDYRHGPMMLNNERALTIILVGPGKDQLQTDMLEDLEARKCILITVSAERESIYGADENIYIGDMKDFGVMGIPFIFIMQCLAYEKAVVEDTNPGAPIGLNAFITL